MYETANVCKVGEGTQKTRVIKCNGKMATNDHVVYAHTVIRKDAQSVLQVACMQFGQLAH